MEAIRSNLKELLKEAIQAEGAIKGTLQRHQKTTDNLEIIASDGFSPEFLSHFKNVKPFDSSCCGRAFGVGSTIIISDLENGPSFRPNLEVARQAGFKSVKSVPIYNSKGKIVGVISTHFKESRSVWNTGKLNAIIARLAEIIDQIVETEGNTADGTA